MSLNKGRKRMQDRIKEMSKQEDLLLKRKRELELKLTSSSASGGFEAAKNLLMNAPGAVLSKSSKPSQKSNKFLNDGSFVAQFREMKREPSSPPLESLPCSEDSAKLIMDLPTSCDSNIKSEPVCPVNPVESAEKPKLEEESSGMNSDWFQEALQRAREKAKELSSQRVSLSAVSDEISSSADNRPSRWTSTPPAVSLQTPGVVPAVAGFNVPLNVMGMVGAGQHNNAIRGVMLTRLTRDNPAIINYAQRVFGSLDLSEAQWRQCEDQMKMNVVFQLLQAKKIESEHLEQQGKVKYEYDSDEDVDGGTWEHKRRKKEMEDTACRAEELTTQAEGKHHIGDFLPPDELAKFMEKYRAIKEGRDPDLSQYQENQLTEDNVGYKMLKSMGWTEGTGLGVDRQGITAPVNQTTRCENQGLGVEKSEQLSQNDDEYDAYRKRMMLAYRFRPNPLNNPRRAYY